jgi:hypothetical protein
MNHLKKFKKLFPKAAREAEYASGVEITYHGKSFWLNSELQLTGYQIGEKGKILSQEDNEKIAIDRIKQFKDAKVELEKESLVDRLSRLINEARKLKVTYRCFVTWRHPGGDKATILDDGDLWLTFTGLEYCFIASHKKTREEAIKECIRQFEAYIGVKYVENIAGSHA